MNFPAPLALPLSTSFDIDIGDQPAISLFPLTPGHPNTTPVSLSPRSGPNFSWTAPDIDLTMPPAGVYSYAIPSQFPIQDFGTSTSGPDPYGGTAVYYSNSGSSTFGVSNTDSYSTGGEVDDGSWNGISYHRETWGGTDTEHFDYYDQNGNLIETYDVTYMTSESFLKEVEGNTVVYHHTLSQSEDQYYNYITTNTQLHWYLSSAWDVGLSQMQDGLTTLNQAFTNWNYDEEQDFYAGFQPTHLGGGTISYRQDVNGVHEQDAGNTMDRGFVDVLYDVNEGGSEYDSGTLVATEGEEDTGGAGMTFFDQTQYDPVGDQINQDYFDEYEYLSRNASDAGLALGAPEGGSADYTSDAYEDDGTDVGSLHLVNGTSVEDDHFIDQYQNQSTDVGGSSYPIYPGWNPDIWDMQSSSTHTGTGSDSGESDRQVELDGPSLGNKIIHDSMDEYDDSFAITVQSAYSMSGGGGTTYGGGGSAESDGSDETIIELASSPGDLYSGQLRRDYLDTGDFALNADGTKSGESTSVDHATDFFSLLLGSGTPDVITQGFWDSTTDTATDQFSPTEDDAQQTIDESGGSSLDVSLTSVGPFAEDDSDAYSFHVVQTSQATANEWGGLGPPTVTTTITGSDNPTSSITGSLPGYNPFQPPSQAGPALPPDGQSTADPRLQNFSDDALARGESSPSYAIYDQQTANWTGLHDYYVPNFFGGVYPTNTGTPYGLADIPGIAFGQFRTFPDAPLSTIWAVSFASPADVADGASAVSLSIGPDASDSWPQGIGSFWPTIYTQRLAPLTGTTPDRPSDGMDDEFGDKITAFFGDQTYVDPRTTFLPYSMSPFLQIIPTWSLYRPNLPY